MYECPTCRRRWLDANALANALRCYRACDTPLVHMEEDPGCHLDHLPGVVMGEASGIVNLREAIRAVQPRGIIEIPAGRHDEPLVLDKPLTLRRAAGDQREVLVQVDTAPAIRVRGRTDGESAERTDQVTLENITIFRGAPDNGLPMLTVESGVLVLRQCRLDCRNGPGILVKTGARLVLDRAVVHGSLRYGVMCEEGAALEMTGARFQGADDNRPWLGAATGSPGDGAAVCTAGPVVMAFNDVGISGYRRALDLRAIGGTLTGLAISGCGEGLVLEQPAGLRLDHLSFSSTVGPLLDVRGGHCELVAVAFNDGDVQLRAEGAVLALDECAFRGATAIACRLNRDARATLRRCRFDAAAGNGVCVDGGEATLESSTFGDVAGVCLLVMRQGRATAREVTMQGCGVGICAMLEGRVRCERGVIDGAAGSAAMVQDGAHGEFLGTTFRGSRADQVVVAGADEPTSFTDCTFVGGSFAGLRVVDGGRAVLAGREISGHGGSAIVVGAGAQLAASGLAISGSAEYGVLAGPGSAVVLEKCSVAGNAAGGARAVGAAEWVATDCAFEGNGLVGLHLDRVQRADCTRCRWEGHRGQGVMIAGVAAEAAASAAAFRACSFAGNGGEGLLGLGRAGAELKECTAAENLGGAFRVFGGFKLLVDGGEFQRGPEHDARPSRVGLGGGIEARTARFGGRNPVLTLRMGVRAAFTGIDWAGGRWRAVRRGP